MTTTNTITTPSTQPSTIKAADVICSTSVLWARIPGPARITATNTAAAAYQLQPAEGKWDVGGQIDRLDIPAPPAVHAVPVQPVQAGTVIWYDSDSTIRIVTAAGSYLVAQAGAAAIITPLRPVQNNPATDAGKILHQQIPPITAVYSHSGSVLSALQIIDPSIGRVPPRRTAVTAGGYKILRRLKQDAAKDAAEYAAARAAWTVYDRQTYSPSNQPRTWSELVDFGLVPRPDDDDDDDDNHAAAVPPSVWTGLENASWLWEVHVTSPAAAAGTYYVRSAPRDVKGRHYSAGQTAHAYVDQAWTSEETRLKYYIVPLVQPGDLQHSGLRLHQAALQAVSDYVRFLRRNDAAGHLTISLDDQADLVTIAECRIIELLSGPLPDKYPVMTGRRKQVLIRSLSELARYEARKAVNAWRTRQYRTSRAMPLLDPDRNPMIDPPRVAPSAPPIPVTTAGRPVYPALDARIRDVIVEVWPRLPAGARQVYDAVYWHHIPVTAAAAAMHITPQTGYHRLHRAEQRILAAVRKDPEAMRLLRMHHPLITADEMDAAILAAARKAR